jgi:Tol biopolymer transport system component
VAPLPAERGSYSYGTVSPDHRYYAVSVTTQDAPAKVHLLDLKTGEWSVLLDKPGYHAKHEQFSQDGRNRVLIQLNQMPDVKQVLLAELEIGGSERLFPADRPHTPRPTGHEAWVGETDRIFFSTGSDADSRGNVWTAGASDPGPVLVHGGKLRFGHVSVSRCGRYWVGDTGEEGIPIYIGSFATGQCRRAVFSRTVYDGKQWAHAHPYLTADNVWLIFTSTRDGHPQVYGARLAKGWLDGVGG